MTGLAVYINNVSDTDQETKTGKCGDSYKGTEKTRLEFKCKPSTTGKYIHVVLLSSEPKQLALCEVFFNLKMNGKLEYSSLQGNMESFIIPPADNLTYPLSFAFDGRQKNCPTSKIKSQFHSWTIYFNNPIILGNVSVSLKGAKSAKYNVFAGSQLINDGTDLQQAVTVVSSADKEDIQLLFMNEMISFVQYLNVTARRKTGFKLKVCEIKINQSASVLSIYGSFVAIALNQLSSSNLPSKAIDRSFQIVPEACYRSSKQADSWWRLQLSAATAIFYVVITTLPDRNALSEMNGSSVYIGDTGNFLNSGRDNTQCGSTWTVPSSAILSTIFVSCGATISGKFIYIVAANRSEKSLSLCEVQLYNCNGYELERSSSSGETEITMSEETTLSCSASGCPPPAIDWRDPHGKIMTVSRREQNGEIVTSSITVRGSEGSGKYNCRAYNGGEKYFTKDFQVSVFLNVTISPVGGVTVNRSQPTSLKCTANGNTALIVSWTSLTNSTFSFYPSPKMSRNVVSTIDVTNSKGADGGGIFICTARDKKGENVSAQATVSVFPKITTLNTKGQNLLNGSVAVPVLCEAEGYPTPIVSWQLQGSSVELTTDRITVDDSARHYRNGSILKLGTVVSIPKEYVYVCKATNSAGSVSSRFTLAVASGLTFTVDPRDAYGKVGDNLALSCTAKGASVINWYNGQGISPSYSSSSLTNEGLTSTLKLSNVRLSDGSSTYYCKAASSFKLSISLASKNVTVGILGSIDESSFKLRYLDPGGSSTPFACIISANPRPTEAKMLLGNEKLNTAVTKISKNRWRVWRKEISSITAEDGGNYTCIGEMSPLVRVRRTVQLGVTPAVSVRPQSLKLTAGETKTLICTAKGYPIPSITWEKKIGQNTAKLKVASVRIDTDRRENTSQLTFVGNSLDYVGSYQCIATNVMKDGFTTSKNSTVNVSVKPVIVTDSSSQTVKRGIDVAFKCLATGYPPPTITWRFRERPLRGMVFSFLLSNGISRESTYNLKSVNALANGGVYECTASNAAGRANSVQFALLFDPKVTIALRNKLIDYGEDLTLTCEVTSYPAISLPVQWQKDGQLFPQIFSKDVIDANSAAVTSTFTIESVTEREGGNYTCQGLSRAMISIGIHFAVHPQSGKPFAGKHVSLSCKVVGYPAGTIAWEVSKQRRKYGGVSDPSKFQMTSERTNVSTTSYLTIKSIQSSDTGYYRCQASSASKEALSHPARIDIITSPSAITPLNNVTVNYRQATDLVCVASGYPIPKVTWTSPTNSAFTTRESVETMGKITVMIDVRNENGADGGGEFECTASNGVGRDASAKATVSVKPKIIRQFSRKQTVADGQTASSVECIAEGYPKPEVDWKLKGKDSGLTANSVTATTSEVFYSGGSSLSLGRVSISQNGGVFVCTAENSVGSDSLNFTLTVTIKARFTVQPKDSFSRVGDTVTLSCAAAGASAKFIKWYKKQNTLNSSLSSTAKINQGIKSTLTLSNVKLRDGSQKYFCKVGPFANLLLSVLSKSATVGILGKFSHAFKSQSFAVGHNVSSLACSFKANPRPSGGQVMFNGRVIGSLVANKADTSKDYFWTIFTNPIPSISVQDGGDYTCIGRMSSTVNISRTIQIGVDPFISALPQPSILDAETTRSLSCKAKGFPVPLIYWTKEIGGRIAKLNGSDSVDAAKRERTSNLTFTGDNLDQAGSYRCVATNVVNGGRLKRNISSIVIVAVRPITRSPSLMATRKTNVTLKCFAEGYPLPTITWTFRKRIVSAAKFSSSGRVNSSSTLTRTAVTAVKDGGEYTCNAANSAGKAVPNMLTLKFDPKVTTNPASRTLGYGRSTSLNCSVTSYPALSSPVKWLKDGALLPDSQSTDEIISNNTTVVSTLRFSNVTEETGGNYTCYESSKPAVVKVRDYFAENPKSELPIEGNSASLSCTVVGYPVGNIVWEVMSDNVTFLAIYVTEKFRLKTENKSREKTSVLTIKTIQRTDAGYYRCSVAKAPRRVSSQKARIDVAYLDSITLTFRGKTDVLLGNNFNLSCTAVGNPTPYITFHVTTLDSNPKTKEIKRDTNHTVSRKSKKVTLTTNHSQTSDSGYYFCKATNKAGSIDSNTTKIIVGGPPSKINPENINSTERTNSSITFQWPKPYDGNSPISMYEVKYKQAGLSDGDYKNVVRTNSTALSEKIIGLKPFTTYQILVIAVNVQGSAQGSRPVNFKTTEGVSSSPRKFEVTVTNSTAVYVKWEEPLEPNGIINYYRVVYMSKRRQKRAASIIFEDFNTTFGNITQLRKYTEYELSVRAVNVNEVSRNEITGNLSETKTVTTDQDAPTEPRVIKISPVDDSTLTVRWDQPAELNGIITSYEVSYKRADSSNSSDFTLTIITNGSIRNATIENLLAYTTYEVQVQAFTILSGPKSNVTLGQTDQGLPSSPLNLTISEIGKTKASLHWIEPAIPRGELLNYTVSYKGSKVYDGHEKINVNETKSTPNRNLTIKDLVPNTNWTFYVIASTIKGTGNSSDIITATTSAAAADPVLLPSNTMSVTTTTVAISLLKPSEKNGLITRIDLLVVEFDSIHPLEEIDFEIAPLRKYSVEIGSGEVYVAASFTSRDALPNEFLLGDGKNFSGFVNGPLKAGASYGFVLRVYTASDESLVSVSKPIELATKASGNNVSIIVGVVVCVLLLAVATVIIAILFIRRKHAEKPIVAADSNDGDIELVDSEKPSITAKLDTVLCIAGETVTLNVQVTGQPRPSVVWRFKEEDVPADDPRIVILASGSLKIQSASETDAGLYECMAKSNLGSSYEQVILRMDTLYANTGNKKDKIAKDNFEAYVKEYHADEDRGFCKEFLKLDGPEKHLFVSARKEVNWGKNRYRNIVPYEKSRVVLETVPGVPGSDYINASFFDGYRCQKGYIAAQGPKEKTESDFWRMIWQTKVPTIVMVTNIKEGEKDKCIQYWPDWSRKDFGQLSVSLRQEQSMPDCVVRTLDMVNQNLDGSVETHSVTQFHFTEWPDHGVPAYATSLLNFAKRARSHHEKFKEKRPMLVHCSAGVGRTGTFIVIDYSLQRLKAENDIDIFNLINDLRDNRPNMVQAECQYIFCHDAILEYVLCGDTDVSAHNLRSYVNKMEKVDSSDKKNGFEKQLQLLKKLNPERKHFSFKRSSEPSSSSKNRYSSHLPPDSSLIDLAALPDQPENCTYINAHSVNGYLCQGLYIATQGPLESTVFDFWRMIWEQQCAGIVMLTKLQEGQQEMSARYWPVNGKATYERFTVELDSETSFGDYCIRSLSLANGEETPRLIKQYHYMAWMASEVPKYSKSLLDMLSQIEKAQPTAGSHKIAVVCNNGVERSCTFIAMRIILERLKSEQIVDVFQVVKGLRLSHPDCVTSEEHYRFCYRIASDFLDSFDTYANFKCL